MTPCFGYLRVSTVRQGEGVSLQEQRAAIEDCALRRNLIVTEWFEEKETAAKTGRPVFNHMMKRLRAGHAKGLVVHKLDRSARNLKDWAAVSELMDADIAFHIATEPIDFTSRGGRITADFLAVIATDFSRNQREETRKGLYGRLKQGLYPFRAPIGYLDMGRGQPKAPCPIKAPLIKDLFALYLSGEHSIRTLHAEMARRGLRGHEGKQVSVHGIEKILSNSFYTGLITIKRTGKTFAGKHKPLLSKADFSRIQLIKSGRAVPKVTRHNHRFQGVFRCGLCGGAMVPEKQKGHVYYRCHNRDCMMRSMREDVIEGAVKAKIAQMELSQDTGDKMRDYWAQDEPLETLAAQRRSLLARIEAYETKLARATDLLIEGTLEQAEYEPKKREVAFEIEKLRGLLDELPDPKQLEFERNAYLELFGNLKDTYNASSTGERRHMLKNLFEERRLLPKDVHLKEAQQGALLKVKASENERKERLRA